ncbi:MAG: glycoside hydrolase family protein [Ignavibacteriaceae bacterium]
MHEQKYGTTTLFDPKDGFTIIEPPGKGNGYWAGAPSIYYDNTKGKFYLSYRIREPHPSRGIESRIAESSDGIKFRDIWSLRKEDLGSTSIERSALLSITKKIYRLYVSYVDPVDNRWRIDMMEAESPEHFDVSLRKMILTAKDLQVEGVKDPYILVIDGMYYMFYSYAQKLQNVSHEQTTQLHSTGDIFNTGKVQSLTGIALSQDGISFRWLRDVSLMRDGWDSYTFRVTCVLPTKTGFIVFYDGNSEGKPNYEELTGLATSQDLVHYERISKERPMLISSYGIGSLRYIDAIRVDNDYFYYYEYSRSDGSHELRLNIVKRGNLGAFDDNN